MVRALVVLLFVCNSKGSLSGSMTTMMTVPSFAADFAFVYEEEAFASFYSSSSLGLKKITSLRLSLVWYERNRSHERGNIERE